MSWKDLLKRITFRPHLNLSVRVDDHMYGSDVERLLFELRVPDIHTGQPSTVYFSECPPPFEKITTTTAIEYLRRAARQALEHELDECLLLDGKQVFDPHAHEKRMRPPTPEGNPATGPGE